MRHTITVMLLAGVAFLVGCNADRQSAPAAQDTSRELQSFQVEPELRYEEGWEDEDYPQVMVHLGPEGSDFNTEGKNFVCWLDLEPDYYKDRLDALGYESGLDFVMKTVDKVNEEDHSDFDGWITSFEQYYNDKVNETGEFEGWDQ